MMPDFQASLVGMAKIIVTGNDQRREFELGALNTIGRHPDNTLQILDRIVSKEHAQVVRQPDGRYLFRDLGSLNGSFLRGERVSEHILLDTDEIMMGSTCLTFQERSTTESMLQKVTIAPSATESLIRQKIQAPPPSREFLAEREITDLTDPARANILRRHTVSGEIQRDDAALTGKLSFRERPFVLTTSKAMNQDRRNAIWS
jgi:hypothetical protein